MADEPSSPGDDRLLFCPFCRECFEGRVECPEHELALVEFQALPRRSQERAVRWDEPLSSWDLRFGRAELMLGVVASLVGFFALPLVAGSFDDRLVAWTALEMAARPARNLWTVPVVAAFFVLVLVRRRTPIQLRGARLAGVMLALMPIVSLGYSLWNVQRGVDARHGALALGWGPGVWAILAASLAFLVGSVRLGRLPHGEGVPHGASPDEPSSRIDPR